MEQDYPIRFNQSKTGLYIQLMVSIIIGLCARDLLTGVFITVLLSIPFIYNVIRYRAVWLYEDKLYMVGIAGKIFYEANFFDIAHAEFVENAADHSRAALFNNPLSLGLVIVKKDGSKIVLPFVGIKRLKIIHAFIQERLRQS